MKKVIPFTKEIDFNTPISEIVDIEVGHNLVVKENNCIDGNILVDGAYKKYEASNLDDNFHYELPFTIDVDDKYNIMDATITINDFYYEIESNLLKINIELEIGNVIEKEITSDRDDFESIEVPIELEEAYSPVEIENNSQEEEKFLEMINKNISEEVNNIKGNNIEESNYTDNNSFNYSEIFNTISKDESFVTYYVYIYKENDKIDDILDKYNVTYDDLLLYNDLTQVTTGTKLIIPCHNE